MATPSLAKEKLHTVCQMIIDEQGRSLVHQGKCDIRQSPASTFKVALSLMGFDNGDLQDANHPQLQVKKSYQIYLPEWGQPTDPQHWMRHSVVWYSHELVKKLGAQTITRYLTALNYGNQDMRGHAGADPMKSFWIGSSLKISPAEQVNLMRQLMLGNLNVSDHAIQATREIMDLGPQANGWTLYGKTGSAVPRSRDGKRLTDQRFGWFVGFAEKGERKIAFAKLVQSGREESKSLGLLAREQVVGDYFTRQSPL